MRITPRELSQRLACDAERFCRWLLPHGKIESGEWCVGSVGGEAGKSCKVHLSGDRAGVWCDFSNGTDKGDLLDLIAASRGCSIGQAIREAKDWLGIRDPESHVPPKSYSKPPTKLPGVKKLTAECTGSPVMNYLTGERKLTVETVLAFRVSEHQREIAFPSFSADGDLVTVKYIGLDRDDRGKKIIRNEKGCAPALFGWHALRTDTREVVITEGHIDAMTWHQIGFSALSIPNGTGDAVNWIEFEWENLERFDTIFLSFDDDKPGEDTVQIVANRLGRHRCLRVTLAGHKDANDALQGGMSADWFNHAIAGAKPFTPQQIKSPADFRDGVVEFFHPSSGVKPGLHIELFDHNIGFRPGEMTVWTGVSGHGKSALLSLLMLYAMQAGQKVAIASMEMLGAQTLARMICQMTHQPCPSKDQIDESLDWLRGRLWIFDVMGNVKRDTLLELMEYSSARHAVDHFVIDSLMKCDVGSDDYDGQRVFVDALSTFAKRNDCHVHLVAHSRKGQDENPVPGKLDVKGSSDIINQPDNVLVVWRNKSKEQQNRNGGAEDAQSPDGMVYCDKQRTTGWEGEIPLWFFRKIFTHFRMEKGNPVLPKFGPALEGSR